MLIHEVAKGFTPSYCREAAASQENRRIACGNGSMAGEDGEGRLAWEEVKGLDVVAI